MPFRTGGEPDIERRFSAVRVIRLRGLRLNIWLLLSRLGLAESVDAGDRDAEVAPPVKRRPFAAASFDAVKAPRERAPAGV
jgi:hypothetical protein